MAVRRVREVGRFARPTVPYRIIEYAHMQDVRTRPLNARDVEGLHELTTHDGMRVNVIGDNEYLIPDLELKVTRVHPGEGARRVEIGCQVLSARRKKPCARTSHAVLLSAARARNYFPVPCPQRRPGSSVGRATDFNP